MEPYWLPPSTRFDAEKHHHQSGGRLFGDVTDRNGSTNCSARLTVYATPAAALAPAVHASGQYAFAVAGVPGYKYVVQTSTNLINWFPIQTNTAPFTFADANAGKFSQRFYRSVYLP